MYSFGVFVFTIVVFITNLKVGVSFVFYRYEYDIPALKYLLKIIYKTSCFSSNFEFFFMMPYFQFLAIPDDTLLDVDDTFRHMGIGYILFPFPACLV